MINIAIGCAALAYGLFTFWARSTRPESFKKLGPMKELYGDRAGYLVHFVGYSLVPMGIGVFFLLSGLGVLPVPK